jgi:sortase (surface protein transpeptidase)
MLGNSRRSIRIVSIGVTDGVLKPPDNPSIVGWWEAGPMPGGPGRAVIAGHIDSPRGLGAFAALVDLSTGDRIAVTSTDGAVRQYVVSERLEIEKADLDPGMLDRQDVSDLLLVTCIGEFNRRTLSYESNLLIVATPE